MDRNKYGILAFCGIEVEGGSGFETFNYGQYTYDEGNYQGEGDSAQTDASAGGTSEF